MVYWTSTKGRPIHMNDAPHALSYRESLLSSFHRYYVCILYLYIKHCVAVWSSLQYCRLPGEPESSDVSWPTILMECERAPTAMYMCTWDSLMCSD